MFLVHRALNFRRKHPRLFAGGDYIPLEIHGRQSLHACAYALVLEREAALVVVPRLTCSLMNCTETVPLGSAAWDDTVLILPRGMQNLSFRNEITHEEPTPAKEWPLSDLLKTFPLALLWNNQASNL
jgi:(1->4)-alpha-D-glucan 1-alpha-D-glucosylmutase